MSTIRWAQILCVAAACSCTPLDRQILPTEEEDAGPLASVDTTDGGSKRAGSGGSKAAANGKISTGSAGKNAGRGGSGTDDSDDGESSDARASASRGGARDRSEAGGDVSEAKAGCAVGQLECEDACVPDDKRNCGRCGHDCTALTNVIGPVGCSDGECVLSAASCAPGWAHCTADPDDGCETDITQPTDCGECGVVCEEGTPMCSAGECVSGCPDSLPTLCGGTCANTKTDAMHCGECDSACTTDVQNAQPVCANGSCKFECKSDFMKCGEICADLETDNKNCGSCGNACSGGKQCKKGRCECPSGLNDCNGVCKADAPTSCGSSCQVCRSGVSRAKDTCVSGRCDFECNAGLSYCNGECVDTAYDNNNCGFCGYQCRSPESCGLGLCLCPLGQHKCGGSCVSNYSKESCGLFSCTPCRAPAPGYSVSCDGFSCVSTCIDSTICTP